MKSDLLTVDISRLNPAGDVIRGEVPVAALGLEDERMTRFKDPVKLDLSTQQPPGELVVHGVIEVLCEQECSRCAEFYSTTVRVSSFLRAYEIPDGTDTVDLTADIREDVLLALPPFPLCSDDCKGLCPQCGKNRNEGPCACKPPPKTDNPWAALNDLDLR